MVSSAGRQSTTGILVGVGLGRSGTARDRRRRSVTTIQGAILFGWNSIEKLQFDLTFQSSIDGTRSLRLQPVIARPERSRPSKKRRRSVLEIAILAKNLFGWRGLTLKSKGFQIEVSFW